MHVAANTSLPACAHLFISARLCMDTLLSSFYSYTFTVSIKPCLSHCILSRYHYFNVLYNCRNIMFVIQSLQWSGDGINGDGILVRNANQVINSNQITKWATRVTRGNSTPLIIQNDLSNLTDYWQILINCLVTRNALNLKHHQVIKGTSCDL